MLLFDFMDYSICLAIDMLQRGELMASKYLQSFHVDMWERFRGPSVCRVQENHNHCEKGGRGLQLSFRLGGYIMIAKQIKRA